jgi:hypothetical protein
MKKLVLIFLALLSFTSFVGCQIIQNKGTELIYESLSEKEEHLLNLTGNKVLMYKLNNIPSDKEYEILLTYEVYEKDTKVKEETITGISKGSASDKSESRTIGINFQDNKIRYLLADEGAYASGSHDIEEDLTKYSHAFLTNNVDLTIGTEIYIYYANLGNSISSIQLGAPIDLNVTKDILKDSESNVFIKLSFKEI